jgi:hypothetical protein
MMNGSDILVEVKKLSMCGNNFYSLQHHKTAICFVTFFMRLLEESLNKLQSGGLNRLFRMVWNFYFTSWPKIPWMKNLVKTLIKIIFQLCSSIFPQKFLVSNIKRLKNTWNEKSFFMFAASSLKSVSRFVVNLINEKWKVLIRAWSWVFGLMLFLVSFEFAEDFSLEKIFVIK